MFWNPFNHLRESKEYPYGRLIRSSFKQRMIDTFITLNGGGLFELDMGIMDYLFPLPRLMSLILVGINRSFPMPLTTTTMILAILSIGLWVIPTAIVTLPKLLMSIITTTILSPVVALTHFWFKSEKQQSLNNIKKLKVNLYKNNINCISSIDDKRDLCEQRELHQIVPEKEYPLLSIRPLCQFPETISPRYGEYCREDPTGPRKLYLGLFSIKPRPCEEDSNLLGLPLGLIAVNSENKEPIRALLRTNSFWTTQHIETPNSLPVLENMLNEMRPA